MVQNVPLLVAAVTLTVVSGSSVVGLCDDKSSRPVMACAAGMNDFDNEVWAKVGAAKCLTCHRQGGDAGASEFVLTDLNRTELTARAEAMRSNRDAFAKMALVKEKVGEKDEARMLLKAVGQLDHGGAAVLKADSSGYRVLAEFVRRVNG